MKRKTNTQKWKTRKSQDSRVPMFSKCSTKCTGLKDMEVHISGRAHQTRKHKAEQASENQQLCTPYASLAAALSSSNSAVHCLKDQAKNQNDDQYSNVLENMPGGKNSKAMKQSEFLLRVYSVWALQNRTVSSWEARS